MKHIVLTAVLLFSTFLSAQQGLESLTNYSQLRKVTVNFDLKNADLDDVLKIFSDRMSVNIVKNRNVDVKVTVRLKDVPVLDAFDVVCRTHNLNYIVTGGVIQVYNQKDYIRENGVFGGDMIVYRLKNTRAEVMYKKLAEMGIADAKLDSFGAPIIFSDERINAIKVTGNFTALQRTNIIRVLESLDLPTPQVLLEAKILSVKLTKNTSYGIRWNAIMGKLNLNLPTGLGFGSSGKASDVSSFVIEGSHSSGKFGIDLLLDALATEGNVKALSSPRLVVLNNEEAKIIEGNNEPYKEIVKDNYGGTVENWKFVEVGIGMTVKPSVFSNQIELTVSPEISSATREVGTEAAPTITKSEMHTVVRVRNGSTLVLGGLIKENKEKVTVGIPFLSKIPILGLLFSNKNLVDTRYEIVFFITPTIME